MAYNVTVPLKRIEKERLSRLAIRFGLSLPEFSRKVLTELQETFPVESFEDYERPRHTKSAFEKALKNLDAGRVTNVL